MVTAASASTSTPTATSVGERRATAVVVAALAPTAGWAALAMLPRMTGHVRALWTSLAIAALLASLGPIAIVASTTETRILLALMHVIVAIALILGLRATIPAHRSADGRQGQS